MARKVSLQQSGLESRRPTQGKPSLQIVYFTGVGGYSGDFLARREESLLSKLQQAFPEAKIHRDLFPYSVSNLPLDGERVFRWLWVWLHKWRLRIPNSVFDALIVIRNIGQLLVSADPRYGPSFNSGLSEQLRSRLHSGSTTVFLAYSGGAQMAIGSGLGLRNHLSRAPHLIALGGVFTDDPSVKSFASVTQVRGYRDRWVPELGRLLFPGLWRWQFWSAWNQYKKSSRFTETRSTPHSHVGGDDYFGFQKVQGDSEMTYQDLTVGIVASRIEKILSAEANRME